MQINFDKTKPRPSPEIPEDMLRIGTDQDSRQNCLSLHPKPPTANWSKFINSSGHVMRFFSWLLDRPEQGMGLRHETDRERRFIVSYFLADDTVSIFEPPVRNSGILGGKFLERSILYKPGSHAPIYFMPCCKG